ncbi:MAG: ATP-binding cassette domain-containing protein [Planctomycetota bacterium]
MQEAIPTSDPAEGSANTRPVSPAVRLVGVNKAFGSQTVLDDLDLDLERGRTTVVLGPSGCGKSVMLKHIVGLLRPDAGEVWLEGRRIDQLSERELVDARLAVGLLFQMGALFDSMTVQQNLDFPLREHARLSRAERLERINAALETVDMGKSNGKLPAQLSGGQRKRVALARALVMRPRVLLYDEPTTGLDPIRAAGIDELVNKLTRDHGMTSLVVTHDLVSARRVADRMVMLSGGRVVADGSYADLEGSSEPFVRAFLAANNPGEAGAEVIT